MHFYMKLNSISKQKSKTMRTKFKMIIVCMLPFFMNLQSQNLDLQLSDTKIKFGIGATEYANLNYQYYPFGPIYELRSHHYLGTLRLNSLLNIDFRTGGQTESSVVINNFGYTKLGSDAPSIKMKMLYGTSANTVNGATQLPHGLGNANRILSVQVHMNFQPGGNDVFYPPSMPFDNQSYTYFWDEYNVTVQNSATSGTTTVLNKPVRVLIFYQQ